MTVDRGKQPRRDPELTELARQKLTDHRRCSAAEQRDAVVLLADIYAVGLRYGITPRQWAAVTDLADDVLSALSLRDRAPNRAPLPPRQLRRSSTARENGRTRD